MTTPAWLIARQEVIKAVLVLRVFFENFECGKNSVIGVVMRDPSTRSPDRKGRESESGRGNRRGRSRSRRVPGEAGVFIGQPNKILEGVLFNLGDQLDLFRGGMIGLRLTRCEKGDQDEK